MRGVPCAVKVIVRREGADMKFRKSPEERAAAEAQKRREQERRERPMWDHLEAAVQAAAAGDIPLEEREIQRGARCAEAINGVLGREIKGLQRAPRGLHPPAQAASGEAARQRWPDLDLGGPNSRRRQERLADGRARPCRRGHGREHHRVAAADPDSDGDGRGAAGLGIETRVALAKKETVDNRELCFILEHPEWGAVIRVNPEFGEVVRTVAVGVNQAARQLALVETDAAPPSPAPGPRRTCSTGYASSASYATPEC
jgi:hypothetical protein